MILAQARKLENEATNLLNKVEALADNDNRQAEQMLMKLWERCQRRSATQNELINQTWGTL